MVKNICNMKIDDDESSGEKKLHRLQYIIHFERHVNVNDMELAEKAGLKIISF